MNLHVLDSLMILNDPFSEDCLELLPAVYSGGLFIFCNFHGNRSSHEDAGGTSIVGLLDNVGSYHYFRTSEDSDPLYIPNLGKIPSIVIHECSERKHAKSTNKVLCTFACTCIIRVLRNTRPKRHAMLSFQVNCPARPLTSHKVVKSPSFNFNHFSILTGCGVGTSLCNTSAVM